MRIQKSDGQLRRAEKRRNKNKKLGGDGSVINNDPVWVSENWALKEDSEGRLIAHNVNTGESIVVSGG